MKPTPSRRHALGNRKQTRALDASTPAFVTGGQGRSYTATEAKNGLGRLLDEAIQGATVVITKHDAPRAVLISMDKFNALQEAPQVKLNTLSAEFDDLLARMQTTAARKGMERAFHASEEQLGKAALSAARKRGR